jgi:hypothetical protein
MVLLLVCNGMVLIWYWYGIGFCNGIGIVIGMVLVFIWYGMVLVWFHIGIGIGMV